MTTLGILGAGRVGTALARRAVEAGYRVLIAASGAAEDIALIVDFAAPGATAVTSAEAAARADLVVLSLPLHKYSTLDPDLFRGKIVVDAMNHWPPSDGQIGELAHAGSSSQMVQEHLRGVRVVKTLNHIGYHELETDHRSRGASDRRALAIAGDDGAARGVVGILIEGLGFDAVDAGPLAAGSAFEPGTRIFEGAFRRDELAQMLAEPLSARV